MNFPHIHMVLVYFPVVGTVIGFALLFASIITKSYHLQRDSLVLLLVIAVLAIPTVVTGGGAEVAIVEDLDVSVSSVAAHRDAALLAAVFLVITGLLSWLGLWQIRRFSRAASWNVPGVMLVSLVTIGLMLRAADMGAEISHPEIRSVQESAVGGETGSWSQSIDAFMSDGVWTWAASETLHFIGMAMLFGVVLLVNLRILGVMKEVPYSTLHSLLPLGVLGFLICLGTGALFFVTDAPRYVGMPGFLPKIGLMVIAGVSVVYFTALDHVWTLGRDDDAPATAKVVSGLTICVWLGILFFGRTLPYFAGGG